MRRLKSKHPLYGTWNIMRQRCNNPAAANYHNYGGRGISVCAEWDEFWQFVEDMGPKPQANFTLERLNTDGDYGPDNCVWASRTTQALNRRTTVWVEYEGKQWCQKHLAKYLGINKHTLRRRLSRGVRPDQSLQRRAKLKLTRGPHSRVEYITSIPGVILTKGAWEEVMETTSVGTHQFTYYRVKNKRDRHGNRFQVWQWRCMGKEYQLGRVKEGESFWDMVYSKWGRPK